MSSNKGRAYLPALRLDMQAMLGLAACMMAET